MRSQNRSNRSTIPDKEPTKSPPWAAVAAIAAFIGAVVALVPFMIRFFHHPDSNVDMGKPVVTNHADFVSACITPVTVRLSSSLEKLFLKHRIHLKRLGRWNSILQIIALVLIFPQVTSIYSAF
jgi:hypothetical protein